MNQFKCIDSTTRTIIQSKVVENTEKITKKCIIVIIIIIINI